MSETPQLWKGAFINVKSIQMNKVLLKNNQVSICKGNLCVSATGEKANLIMNVMAIIVILIGISTLIKSASN